MALVQSLDDQM
jgi:hypothetical protein